MNRSRATPARWWRSAAKRLLQVVVGLAVLYLVAMNVFLKTRLFRNAVGADADTFRVEYASAYSLVPGRIHVEELTIRGKDRHVEWILALDRCDFTVAFTDLLHRQFHAEHVRGDGLSFRVRLRVVRSVPQHDAALPPIDGFPDPPLVDAGAPPAPLTDAQYALWGVRLDDVDAERVRELWIDTIRYTGEMRVRGRWLFRPVRWLDVGPAIVDARDLTVAYAGRTLATDLVGALDVTVHPFDVRVPSGLEVLRNVSLTGSMHGLAKTADALDALLDIVDVRRGDGPIAFRVAIDHGVLRPGTHIESEALDGVVDVKGIAVTGALRATFDVLAADEGAQAIVTARASNVVARKGAIRVEASSVDSTLTSRALDLSREPFADATFVADLAGVATPSVAAWQSIVPATTNVSLESGSATVSGHFDGSFQDERAHGVIAFAVADFRANRGNDRLSCVAKGDVTVADLSFAQKTFVLGESRVELRNVVTKVRGVDLRAGRVSVSATRADVSLPGHTATGQAIVVGERLVGVVRNIAVLADLRANVVLRRLDWNVDELDLSDSDVRVRGSARLRGGEGRSIVDAPSLTIRAPRFVLDSRGRHGKLIVDLPRAELADLRSLGEVVPFPNDVELQGGRGSVGMHVAVDIASLAASGTATIAGDDVRVRLASCTLRGKVAAHLVAVRRDGSTDITGSTFAFDGAPDPTKKNGWWARAALTDSELRLWGGARFRSKVHVSAQNGSPAAAMIAASTHVPRWVIDAVPMNDLRADADVRMATSSLQIRSLVARGGSDTVRVEYANLRGNSEWVLSVEAGPIHAGFHRGDGKSQFVMFGVRPWFDDEVVSLKAREQNGTW